MKKQYRIIIVAVILFSTSAFGGNVQKEKTNNVAYGELGCQFEGWGD